MRLVVYIATILCVACAADGEPELMSRRFALRPIDVAISSAFSDECVSMAVLPALDFYRAHAVSLTQRIADAQTTGALNGIAQVGVIGISPGHPSMRLGEIAHGETEIATTIGGDISWAGVTLGSCGERVTAHELGHALGLVHLDVQGNLMHSQLPRGGWDLTMEQLRWIAD